MDRRSVCLSAESRLNRPYAGRLTRVDRAKLAHGGIELALIGGSDAAACLHPLGSQRVDLGQGAR